MSYTASETLSNRYKTNEKISGGDNVGTGIARVYYTTLACFAMFLHPFPMNIRMIALGLSLLLVACQTPGSLVGSGPLNLSTDVERYYNERYKTYMGAEYFVVSRDGRHANFSYCPAGSGGCAGREVVYEVIEGCEKRSGTEVLYLCAERLCRVGRTGDDWRCPSEPHRGFLG